jgi:hypothetical protein
MKKIIVVSLALCLSLGAFAQTEGIGIGAILGSNVDFTAKFWMSEKTAFVASAGIYIWGYGGFHANVDYLIHNWSFDVAQDQMKVYFGPGVGMGVYLGNLYYSSNLWVTLRAPVGVGYYFHGFPLEAFVELAPGLDLFGPWGVNFRWASYVGARWYF